MSAGHFVGVDVMVPYGEIEACFDTAERIRLDAVGIPGFRAMRSAAYFTPEFVNLGLHVDVNRAPDCLAAAHAFVERAMAGLAPLRVVPYRWGRLWHAALTPKLDPVYRALMRDLKHRWDPDGVLHPGASIFAP
jgi:hypothetical protein